MTLKEPTNLRAVDGSTYLDQAEINIKDHKFSEALELLRCAQPFLKQNSDHLSTTTNVDAHRYMQLQALCRIELAHGSSTSLEAWRRVFGLENSKQNPVVASMNTTTSSTSTVVNDIKRQYKRLAILIHPDKCQLPCAQDTFKKLQQGMDALIESLECSEKARKKVKREGNEFENEDKQVNKESFEEEEEEFAWWSEWDNPYADKEPCTTTTAGEEGLETQQKKEKEDEEINFLTSLDCEKLAKEVRTRQDAMLSRPPPGSTLQDLKIALLRARKVLNEKLEEEKEKKNQDGGQEGGGGFLL